MRATITVSVPKKLKEQLDRAVSEQDVSRSDIVRESLEDYLFFRRFRALRNELSARAQSKGIYTDEDAFHLIS